MTRHKGGRPALDLTGQRFGALAVIAPSSRRSSNRGVIWACHCQCGRRAEVDGAKLRTGLRTSCGCRARNGQRAAEAAS